MKKITLSIIVTMFAFAPAIALASPNPELQSYLPQPLVRSKAAAVDGYIVSQVNGGGAHAQTTVGMRGDIYSDGGGVVSVSGSIANAAGTLLIPSPSFGPGPGFSYSGPGIAIPQHSTTERIAAESKSLLMYGPVSVRPSVSLAYLHTSGDMMVGGGENYVTVGGGLNVAYKDVLFASVRRAAVDNGFAAAPNVYAVGGKVRNLTVAVGYVVPRVDMFGVPAAKNGEYIRGSDEITQNLSISAIYVSGLKICEAGVCTGIRTASANLGVAYPDDPTHPLASYDRGLSLHLRYVIGNAKIGVYGRYAPSPGAGSSDTASLGLSAGVSF